MPSCSGTFTSVLNTSMLLRVMSAIAPVTKTITKSVTSATTGRYRTVRLGSAPTMRRVRSIIVVTVPPLSSTR